MAKKKHQPPAKKRYSDTHPIISVRVDLSLKQQLDEIYIIMSGKITTLGLPSVILT